MQSVLKALNSKEWVGHDAEPARMSFVSTKTMAKTITKTTTKTV